MREPTELRFGAVRGVGRGIGGDAACFQITLGSLVVMSYRGSITRDLSYVILSTHRSRIWADETDL